MAMNQAPITRPSLLVRLREPSNHAAWEEFVDLYTPLVHGFCRQRGLQEADAADVAQEVMQAVARSIGRFEYQPDKGTFRGWLFTVTRNKFNTFLEKRRRQPQGSGDTAVQQLIAEQPCPETVPERHLSSLGQIRSVGTRRREWVGAPCVLWACQNANAGKAGRNGGVPAFSQDRARGEPRPTSPRANRAPRSTPRT